MNGCFMVNRIYRESRKGLEVRRGIAGLGVFVAEPIKKGEFLLEYWGPILNDEQIQKKGGKYLFEVGKNKTIDGSSRQNMARYVNHACKPNCEVTIRKDRIYIKAIKNIRSGDELSYDYGKEYVDEYIKPYGCRCGACKRK
jgi:uncharacterized protein